MSGPGDPYLHLFLWQGSQDVIDLGGLRAFFLQAGGGGVEYSGSFCGGGFGTLCLVILVAMGMGCIW